MSDSLALIATVFLNDTNDAITDSQFYALTLSLVDTNAVPGEDMTVVVSGNALSELISGQTEDLLVAISGADVSDTLGAQSEDLLLAISGADVSDTIAAQTEAALLGFSGSDFSETNALPTDSKASFATRWATANTTAGTAPTNPTNAHGSNNSTVATCKAAGLAPVVASTLNLRVVQPLDGANSTPVAIAYYNNIAGVGDTFTNQISYRRFGAGANTVLTFPTGDFLVAGTTLALTDIDVSIDAIFTFTHTCTVAATGGSTQIDAVGIQSITVL